MLCLVGTISYDGNPIPLANPILGLPITCDSLFLFLVDLLLDFWICSPELFIRVIFLEGQ